MDRLALKSIAKQQIKGKIGILFAIYLVIFVITFAVSCIPFVGAITGSFFLTPSFTIALVMIFLKLADGLDIKIGDVFEGFYHFWGAFKISFLTGLFVLLWSLLLIVPGIIKSYSYSMAYYIWAENKEMGALEAIAKSKEMMEGHKMDLFVLYLSFIGWYILGYVTFGLGFIYVLPYVNAAVVMFYKSIKDEQRTEILLN